MLSEGGWAARAPHPRLRPLVRRYVGYTQHDVTLAVHRGLPNRSMTLAISLADPVRLLSGPGVPEGLTGQAVVAGLAMAHALIAQPRMTYGLQLDLHPLGSQALLGVPARELASRTVPIDALPVRWGPHLVQRLAEAPDWSSRFDVLDRELMAALRPVTLAAEVTQAWRRLVTGAGPDRVSTIAAEVGWSRRHLSERFGREVGVTPKQAARLVRFERSCEELRSGRYRTLAELAADCGYADQAHLTHEWQALAGCSPSTWIREELPFLHAVTDLAEPR